MEKLELGLDVDPKNFHKMDGVIGKLAQANRAYRELRKASGDAQEAMGKLLPMGLGNKAYGGLQSMVAGYIGGGLAGGGSGGNSGSTTAGGASGVTGTTESIRYKTGTGFQNAMGTGAEWVGKNLLATPLAIGAVYGASKIGESAGRLAGMAFGGKMGARFGPVGAIIGAIAGATIGQAAIDKAYETVGNAWTNSDIQAGGGFANKSTASLLGRRGRQAVRDYYDRTLTFADLVVGGGKGGIGDYMGMRAFGYDLVKSNYEEGLEALAQERAERNKQLYGALRAKEIENSLRKMFRD